MNAIETGQKPPITRRQFARRAAGSAAALLAAGDIDGAMAQGGSPVQDSPTGYDARLAGLAKERDAPFSPAQRTRLPAQLKDIDDSSAALRKFGLADGADEPRFVFSALRTDGA
jgi:hypothetical protein